jgi:hypothetical protein
MKQGFADVQTPVFLLQFEANGRVPKTEIRIE